MKKSLIALAVLAASGASFAQSSVSVYGVADLWFGAIKTPGLTQTVLADGGVANSRFGLKGSEDLGGGLKANFLLEQGFSLDSGAQETAGQAFSRQSYVGFSGGFGEVKLGKMWTAYDDISGAANSGFDSDLNPTAGIWASNGGLNTAAHPAYKANPSNGLYYATPAFSGFTAAVSYSLDEKVSASAPLATPVVAAGVQSTAFNVVYAAGPVMAGFAYQVDNTYNSTVESKFTRLNASYDLGVAKLLGNYGRADYNGLKTNEWSIGANVPVTTALTLSAGYARSTDDRAVDVTRTGFSVVGAYSLSKRTMTYAGVRIDGDAADAKVYAVGVNHSF